MEWLVALGKVVGASPAVVTKIIGDEEAGSSAAFGAQRAGFDSPISDQNKICRFHSVGLVKK